MSEKRKKGYKGEDMAEKYLVKKGFKILHRNYQASYSEIDLIAMDGDWLVFVEVKLRNDSEHGHPEESLTKSKMSFLRRGAEIYLDKTDYDGKLRFDLVAITMKPTFEVMHFEDAFY
jgi:putative endonuclease